MTGYRVFDIFKRLSISLSESCVTDSKKNEKQKKYKKYKKCKTLFKTYYCLLRV